MDGLMWFATDDLSLETVFIIEERLVHLRMSMFPTNQGIWSISSRVSMETFSKSLNRSGT